MPRRDLSNQDYSTHASGELEYVLKKQAQANQPVIPTVTAEEAMSEARVVQHASSRDVVRVLFISQNTELLNPTTQSLDGYLKISDVFDEVHILILREGIPPKQPVFRPEPNVFMYTAAAKFWWLKPLAGVELLKQQLVFADGFRPDLIVARDPFESAVVALWMQWRYGRATQLHVLENYFHPSFLDKAPPNLWRKFLTKFTVPRFHSVRAGTSRILSGLRAVTDVSDVARLPLYNPYEKIAQAEQIVDLKTKYPQYVFMILFVGTLKDPEPALKAIDAARYMLKNSRVGMIIMGDGPGRAECQRRVKTMNIAEQIIFEHRSLEIAQYLRAADLLIVTNTDPFSEELVLLAAGAGIPMVMTETESRLDIFTHKESAYICAPDDVQAYYDGVHDLMDDFSLRQHIIEEARRQVIDRYHEDISVYRQEYRDSIESALFSADEAAEDTSVETTEIPDGEVEQA